MRVVLNVKEDALERLKLQAESERRSRKNFMEGILESAANCFNPIEQTNNNVEVAKPATQKSKVSVVISYEQFMKMISNGGCNEPEDHRIFIETVNNAQNLSQRQKESLILASRTKQS
jgi:hypothetical protein